MYRISRHTQYLGWILWTYEAYLLLQRELYPRRSWGIGASLPWLLSTMTIFGVALTEEVNMRRLHGEVYETYCRSVPFLFPVPGFLERLRELPVVEAVGVTENHHLSTTSVSTTDVLASLLFGIRLLDPLTFFVLPVVLLGITGVATYLPARHASRVDPVRALKVG